MLVLSIQIRVDKIEVSLYSGFINDLNQFELIVRLFNFGGIRMPRKPFNLVFVTAIKNRRSWVLVFTSNLFLKKDPRGPIH